MNRLKIELKLAKRLLRSLSPLPRLESDAIAIALRVIADQHAGQHDKAIEELEKYARTDEAKYALYVGLRVGYVLGLSDGIRNAEYAKRFLNMILGMYANSNEEEFKKVLENAIKRITTIAVNDSKGVYKSPPDNSVS